MNICPCWLDVMYQPWVIRARNKDKPWFDDQCRHAFGLKKEAHRRWTRDRFLVN